MKTRFAVPFLLFIVILLVLWRGLSLHPSQVSSPLINKPIPTFQLPELFNAKHTVTDKNFLGSVTLLNVWATWCYTCAEEHEFLLHLAKDEHVKLIGLDYKDNSITAKDLLNKYGNPFQMVAVDETGSVAIDWGVYGTPETFVIDKKGIIRYKLTGPVTQDNWQDTLKPLIQKLENESA